MRLRRSVYNDRGQGEASLLKLSLYDGESSPIAGIGRVVIPAYVHNVKMMIGDTVFNSGVALADSGEVSRPLLHGVDGSCFSGVLRF